MMDFRCVHARTADGAEVVRYDRAGKWWMEWPSARMISARRLTLKEAVSLAANPNSEVYLRRPGGKRFDAAVIAIQRENRAA